MFDVVSLLCGTQGVLKIVRMDCENGLLEMMKICYNHFIHGKWHEIVCLFLIFLSFWNSVLHLLCFTGSLVYFICTWVMPCYALNEFTSLVKNKYSISSFPPE